MNTYTTLRNGLIAIFFVIVPLVGYDIQHTTPDVKAVAPVESLVSSPTPTTSPKSAICTTTTPYDKDIEIIFGDESCDVKRVLRWTDSVGNVYGENTLFKPVVDVVQKNGSVDRGLMRINSGTFNYYMKVRSGELNNSGIYEWDDMNSPVKSIKMAKIIKKYQGWCAWFAAPNDLCSKNYIDVK